VLDLTAFWAGPSSTHLLTALGAEVIKLESIQRPDPVRYTSTRRPPEDHWWEWSWIFQAANGAKRGITIDLGGPRGQALVRELIAGCDVVVENFTPRVLEHFDLEWPEIERINPRAVLVRMPAFGLDGPWRDKTGFAQTMEQLSGLAWMTGWPDGPPIMPGGACDPLAGVHAMIALLVALEHRRQTGRGSQVEATMVEVAINIAAEQVVEYTSTGQLLTRAGNRGPVSAPQGVYATADEEWVAIAVPGDEEWDGLRRALGDPQWAADPALKAEAARRAAHDELDAGLAGWCAAHAATEIVDRLTAAGVPAAVVTSASAVPENEHLRARGYFERRTHPIVGELELPAIPLDFSDRPRPLVTEGAPTVGQHNDDVLERLLGLGPAERDALRAEKVIGERPLGT
jgi:crotonobetainyl-CoA:carnitine CoA-transferase CaiB-like acyl-CoA transferase